MQCSCDREPVSDFWSHILQLNSEPPLTVMSADNEGDSVSQRRCVSKVGLTLRGCGTFISLGYCYNSFQASSWKTSNRQQPFWPFLSGHNGKPMWYSLWLSTILLLAGQPRKTKETHTTWLRSGQLVSSGHSPEHLQTRPRFAPWNVELALILHRLSIC